MVEVHWKRSKWDRPKLRLIGEQEKVHKSGLPDPVDFVPLELEKALERHQIASF